MAKIITKANLAPAVYEFVVDAPLVAHKCHPGQFVTSALTNTANVFL